MGTSKSLVKKRTTKEENLDNFGKMITNCGNEQGAHFLYNGPCDVIGRRVLSIITTELDMQLEYFESFENALRQSYKNYLKKKIINFWKKRQGSV